MLITAQYKDIILLKLISENWDKFVFFPIYIADGSLKFYYTFQEKQKKKNYEIKSTKGSEFKNSLLLCRLMI